MFLVGTRDGRSNFGQGAAAYDLAPHRESATLTISQPEPSSTELLSIAKT